MGNFSTNTHFEQNDGAPPKRPRARLTPLRVETLVLDLRRLGGPAALIQVELALRRARLSRDGLIIYQVAKFADVLSATREVLPRIALVLADHKVPVGWAHCVA